MDRCADGPATLQYSIYYLKGAMPHAGACIGACIGTLCSRHGSPGLSRTDSLLLDSLSLSRTDSLLLDSLGLSRTNRPRLSVLASRPGRTDERGRRAAAQAPVDQVGQVARRRLHVVRRVQARQRGRGAVAALVDQEHPPPPAAGSHA